MSKYITGAMKDSAALCGITSYAAGQLAYQLRNNESHDDWEEYSTENKGQCESFCSKLVSAIFYQVFIFSSSDRASKTTKNVFYFILKALSVLEIFTFL